MIGNDVVDLDDNDSRVATRHVRVDERVLSPCELVLVRKSPNGDRLRCLLWAAKESAFKLLKRENPGLVFAPARFVVRFCSSGAAIVDSGGHAVRVHFEASNELVHAVATVSAATVISGVAGMRAGDDPGLAVRRLAVAVLSARRGFELAACRIRREGRAPVLVVDGRVAGTLSLSHHGRFLAFAWTDATVAGRGAPDHHAADPAGRTSGP